MSRPLKLPKRKIRPSFPPHLDRYMKYLYPYEVNTLPWRPYPPLTVCIAIACDCTVNPQGNPKLVLVTDKMVSMDISSSEGLKIRPLGSGWSAMLAGNDVSMATPIIGTTRAKLQDSKDYSDSGVAGAIVDVYQQYRRQQIRHTFLSSFGWTLDEFLARGRASFPEGHYLNLLYEIERFDLGCQFLVSGFRSKEALIPSMFFVNNPGVIIPDELTGYSAIGTGASNAISYLDRREQRAWLPLAESVYNGVAAKVLAEKALGVGTKTTVLIMERGIEEPTWVEDEQIEAIKEIWNKEEADIRPNNLKTRVSKILKRNN